MSAVTKLIMRNFYRQAEGRREKLPWHQDAPPEILIEAVHARSGKGRALDVGSGGGTFSVWLAEQGMEVTGIELFPEAIAMASAHAAERNVTVDFVEGDLFEYSPSEPFELVFDSGCLHSLVGGSVEAYKKKLLSWLAPGGDYVLGHWGRRHALDWRPVGPRRRSEATIQKIFTPELHLEKTEVSDFDAPLPFGPVVRGVGYWFRR